MATAEALAVGSSQFYQQLNSERTWEDARKPYYNVWPSIVPMLTRLNLDLDSGLIQLRLPALCIRLGVQIPETLIDDCVRLCCSLCLLENDRSVIEPDVLGKNRDKFEASGDDRYVDKAHRRGKIGLNVGRYIEVASHYRRPHIALVWTGRDRAVPRVVSRRGRGCKKWDWLRAETAHMTFTIRGQVLE
jgi:hypothetical protein